jgi:hypothetical protein
VQRLRVLPAAISLNRMSLADHHEKHFHGGDIVKDIVIGMADGLHRAFRSGGRYLSAATWPLRMTMSIVKASKNERTKRLRRSRERKQKKLSILRRMD